MQHIAILNSKLAKIEDIISGKKTIESRWYKNKISPWNKIKEGEVVYFKKSGGLVEAKAIASKIIQLDNPSISELKSYISKYKGENYINSNMSVDDILKWANGKKYIILIFLKDAKGIVPFDIDKNGFGNAAAWLCASDVNRIKKITP